MPIIDVHTHMFTEKFMALLKAKGEKYNLQTRPDGQVEIFRYDTPVAIPQRGHFDYELRLRDMDAGHVDLAIVSLTCPNVYWGNEEVSCEAARESNDSMAAAQKRWPDRIRWFASLPFEHPQRAVEELKRSCDAYEEIRSQLVGRIYGRYHARLYPHDLRWVSRSLSQYEIDRLSWRRDAALSGWPLRHGG